MATKRQAIRALQKHNPDATLIDDSLNGVFAVQLEAPVCHHWSGSVHSHVVNTWIFHPSKSEYWDCVIEEISALDSAEACKDGGCEFMADLGECEYLEDEQDRQQAHSESQYDM